MIFSFEIEGIVPPKYYRVPWTDVSSLCAIVGHRGKRYTIPDKEWKTCRTCSKHLSGPKPDYDDIIEWNFNRVGSRLSEVFEKESPFFRGLK